MGTLNWKYGLAIGVALAAVLGIPWFSSLWVEYQWFGSLGFSEVFQTQLWTRMGLFVVGGLVAGVCVFASTTLALRLSRRSGGWILRDPTGVARMNLGPLAGRLRIVASALVFLVGATAVSQWWNTWLLYSHRTPFGVSDPILGNDVGFYMFSLPLLEKVAGFALTLVVATLVLTAGTYAARGAVGVRGNRLHVEKPARVHVFVLGAVVMSLLGVRAWLSRYGLLFSTQGPVFGASYSDVNATLPALLGQVVAALLAAGVLVVAGLRESNRLAVGAVAVFAVAEVLAVQMYPNFVHRFTVAPNEAQKEAPYIGHNIAATRHAYGLDQVLERELTGQTGLTHEDIENNRGTLENVRLWDHQPLLETFGQIQEIRTYYEFAAVDNDRYMIDGRLRQTMLSPRELASDSLPNRTWINERFTFTHGYGITLGPVNGATEEGLPRLLIQDIPPESSIDLKVTRPGIYFGELLNDHVFVGTGTREFDYPSGEGNVYTAYDGKAGVSISPLLTRVAVALQLNSLKLLLSNDITEQSRVLLHRRIRDRVTTLAPFFSYDRDPYMVVRDNGTLAWIMDGYTVSRRYPYSQPMRRSLNYIRNSVKVVIDAYDGTTTYYSADDQDPILATWRKVFPNLVRPLSEMPKDIERHLRYPEDLFQIQAQQFSTYHMKRPELLYNREDQWEVPALRSAAGTGPVAPYYTVMRLPGESKEEYILMLPFTPKSKDNLAAWMVARMDGEHRGQMVVYQFPKDRLVYGPQQILNRINQDADISRQISLWDQRGSEAILGTLLVIPIEKSLVYVCPLYLRSSGGRIPELKRVIVVHENQIAMDTTLEGAIHILFPKARNTPTDPTDTTVSAAEGSQSPTEASETGVGTPVRGPWDEAMDRIVRAHQETKDALKQEDWKRYGIAMAELRDAIESIENGAGTLNGAANGVRSELGTHGQPGAEPRTQDSP